MAAEKNSIKKYLLFLWLREMSDADAYMALVLANAQSELSPLERGMHALGSDMGVREYARAIGRDPALISRERQAAEVLTEVNAVPDGFEIISGHQ